MTVHKWKSNSPELLATIPPELREAGDLRIAVAPGDCAKALGLHWDTVQDFPTPSLDAKELATKRSVSSTIACSFDVMGWFSPAILPAKVLWNCGNVMGRALPTPLQQKWKAWIDDLPALTTHSIPRHMGKPTGDVLGSRLWGSVVPPYTLCRHTCLSPPDFLQD